MKKSLFSIILFLFSIIIYSQNATETVYLKNGSIIKGIIIEQIPGESLKLMTKDKNVFVYNYDEVEKITKEVPRSYSGISTYPHYRGFVDFGYSIGVGSDIDDTGRIDFTTSHGVQVNPYLYVGLGAGVNYYSEAENASYWSFPIFFNPRVNFIEGPVSPFLDMKVGYALGQDVKGFYLAPSVGAGFRTSNSNMINVSAGYTLQNVEVVYYNGYSGWTDRKNIGAITLKVGFEF